MLSHGQRHDGPRELLGDEGVSRGLTWGGTVVAALGVLFTLQGLGLVGGSAMTGSTTWVLLGPVIAAMRRCPSSMRWRVAARPPDQFAEPTDGASGDGSPPAPSRRGG